MADRQVYFSNDIQIIHTQAAHVYGLHFFKRFKNNKMTNEIPRRIYIPYNVPAEAAITQAIIEIKQLGEDVRLTDAKILLAQAKNLVSDYIDEQLQLKLSC